MARAKFKVDWLRLATSTERRLALAQVRVGNITIKGLSVWASASGKLHVRLPSSYLSAGYGECVVLPPELRERIEAAVLAEFQKMMERRRR